MLKAVIFDMDGVLIDSEPLHYEANRLLLERRFNINLDYEYYKQYIGSTVTYLWEKTRNDLIMEGYSELEKYDAMTLRNMADEIKEELINTDGYMEIDGAPAFVKSLKGRYKLAVASSSYLKNIERNVNNLHIAHCFDELVSGTEVKSPKPSPDIFLLAAERLGVKPNECIVIEDSENGVLAAKAAGMACVGFINENSGNQNLSKADYLFESFEGIDGDFLNMVHAHCFDERFVVAETDRLLLREILTEDAGDEACTKLIKTALHIEGMSDEEFKQYINEYRKNSYKFLGFGLWLIELLDDGLVIGIAGVDRKVNGDFELGYYILEEYRRCGYAYETCAEILDFIRDYGIDKLNVSIERENVASIQLAKKLMFDEFYSNDKYVFMDRSVQKRYLYQS